MDRTSALLQFRTARQTKGLSHDDLHRAIPRPMCTEPPSKASAAGSPSRAA